MTLVSNFLTTSKYLLLAAIIYIIAPIDTYSQSWVAQNQQNGFILKKVVSDTTIATGQQFSYTIYFTIPAGASNVTITDQLPPSLLFLGSAVTSACGTPTITAPPVNSQGGSFSLNWSSVPGGCTGSFTITVAFENGTTCPGTSARNNVCLTGSLIGQNVDFCTPFVTTTATATNPWGINKYPIGTAWQGGNCQYLTASDTITWQVCVYKAVGTTGQLNLVSGIVRDTLPVGAQLVSSTCGATQTGNVITWNVGNMNADQMYNTACCQFSVYYPPSTFPNGSQISNQATLSGSLGPVNQPCSNFTMQSNQVCVEKKSITSATLSKWVYTNRQPGCDGQYLIYICNTGTTTISLTALDTLPSQLTNFAISSAWNLTASLSGGIVSINGSLAPGACGYIYVSFTIPQSTTIGSTITNCVTLNISGNPPQQACNSFVVDTPAPKPCLWKEVCNKQNDYTPGSTFRYRLRIQNIGGMPITGATLTDVLNPNLEYVGNPSFYIGSSWNTACTTTPSNPWSGVNLSYNSTSNTITALIDTIPATCQNLFYASCGMYGTGSVPYYFIEMDVKVRDSSALGNVPNQFSVSGGSLGSAVTSSNIENILVIGVVGFNLEKGVKKPADTTYTNAISTTAGANVDYKLKMNSSGTAALRHVTFTDLLPLNNGAADSKILSGCGSRGSQFNIPFSSLGTSSPTVASFWNNSATSLANVNAWTPTGAPGNSFSIGCGTTGTWTNAAWVANQKNLGAYFGPVAVGSAGAEITFSGLVAANALPTQNACNTFAASGWTKHLIQSSISTFQLAGQLESPDACVTIDTIPKPKPCIEVKQIEFKCKGLDDQGNQMYTMELTANSCAPATLLISSPDGTFAPSSFSITSASWNINTTFTYTSTNNPVKVNYTLICGDEVCRDSILWDVPPCDNPPPVDECCVKFIHTIGNPKIQHVSSTGTVSLNVPMTAGPSPIKKFTATIVSAQLKRACGNAPASWIRIFGDITGGSLVVAPAAGPQLLDLYSREATWGPGACIDWNKGAHLGLNMIFPPFSGGFKCYDSLNFKIRYTFTDCDCRTCDTLVSYTIVRKMQFLPWDDVLTGGLGIGVLKGLAEPGNELQAEVPENTSLIMNDQNSGKLWVISPDNDENNVVIKGIEVKSPEVELENIGISGNNGYMQGDVAFIFTEIKAGQSVGVDLKFNNDSQKMKFPIQVRYNYSFVDSEEMYFTEPIKYMAYVPGAESDDMNIDESSKPTKVHTYALYFSNTNGYEQTISAIGLIPNGDIKILAVGPTVSQSDETYLIPRLQEDGQYLISSALIGEIGVLAGKTIKPIYITVSGVDELNSTIQFNTYGMNEEFVSTGTVKLINPISKVGDSFGSNSNDVIIQSIVPNPANDFVTVTFSTSSILSNAMISIVDMLGREVINIDENYGAINQGTHIKTINVAKLTSGSYYFLIQSDSGTVSKPISIVR